MKYLITGGAGFIGSHIVDRLAIDNEVIVFDNLSSGKEEFIKHHASNKKFKFFKGDLLDPESISKAMKGVDFVFHIAANPDVRHGIQRTRIDLEQGPIATHNLLEAMRANNVQKVAFSSSSTVYGEASTLPTPENYGPMLPISLYGASKLACEGMISSYCHSFDMQAWIFRFANVIGERGTHGVLVDFIDKLRKTPGILVILGDGKQKKSYFLVQDCVVAMLLAVEKSKERVNVFNLGCDDWLDVDRIGQIVVDEMGLRNVKIEHTGGSRGWIGDIPKTWISIEKIKTLGWRPRCNSEQAVRAAVRHILKTRI
jgi:UDP-glucose 4-epimerase